MIHSRRLLRSTLLGVVGAAALLPTQVAQAAELVPVSASVRCSPYHPVSFKISAKVPATTAPGQAVSLTDVQVAVDFDYPFTQLPTGDNVITGRVEVDSVSIATVGATPASVALAGLPRTFAPAAANDSSQTRFLTETISVGDSGAAATAGTGPVVLRLARVDYISSVALTSTGPFTAAGGALAGTFTISDLSGCGFLTGIVSPLTAGSGNAIALQLTPKT